MLTAELVLAATVLTRPQAQSDIPPTVAAAGRTVRLVNAGGPVAEPLLRRVAANIGAAVETVQTFWGADWPREITIVATGSQRQFEAEAGGGNAAQWADIAAVAVADRVDPSRRVAAGQRIVFAPGAVNMTDSAFRIVLNHELFHYAARADTALDAPRWLTEGVADFVARPPTAIPAGTPSPTALPSDADLDNPGSQRSSAYDRAWWFARFIADSYDTATLASFYRAACGAGHVDMTSAVRDVLGIDVADLLARWRQWLTS
ncbi:hypothetical protein [Mycobacterium shimoidei]|uniref:DUF4157 domain-containing protein n=1 Tax=Mycobacterium shimoidei TaxID=29313 RepID=A0A1E3T4L9_MYCSH|nr:hypothetical protein [Mycobacterium shimoidei]MCV7261177.1 hypothetical protein [Mycobacterium shimoidei]ODR08658.1 hypothetical protein BHQ16_20445 [Mycobacterium shimoidei]ORW82926.1 hypothetical protein AWC26_03720 [Mycobacterium shimoidei]SRX94871.1 hypothetical protein [Streptomyces bingchenggensis BCW-1] [Mycobacterium shimoidei]